MQSLRAFGILLTFLLVTLPGIPWQASAVRFNLPRRRTFPHRYHKFLCKLFGIRVTVIGTPVQDKGVLMIGNHTSYFDILVLSSAAQVSFVAKSEVKTWPFFSTLARLQQTVFVERSRRSQTGEARDQIRDRVLQGDALVLFPEGTSSDGNCVLPFKSALMGAAEATIGTDAEGRPIHVPVQPVSVAYVGLYGMPMGRETRPLFAWYGDMDLVPHLIEAVKTGPIDVVVEFHEPLTIDQVGGRKKLAAVTEAIVREGQTRALRGGMKTARQREPQGQELTEAAA
ncbi:MAG TPA: lysophospholipid acyltransferase family protein [Rhizomicrobium sp.]|jgi:1-acyl-sn-glycerol-3-phosphate acyltransferase|nr:lysophospholipid acyltransferase family protein [Rhizomicrobium sp.]